MNTAITTNSPGATPDSAASNDIAHELPELLSLQPLDDHHYRSGALRDLNLNNRVFGGQLLGQCMTAALATIDDDRRPTVLQVVFMSGALGDRAIDYEVTDLQEGGRFSSRRVLASQGLRQVIEAQVSAMREDEPQREVLAPWVRALPQPEALPTNDALAPALSGRFAAAAYRYAVRPTIDFRFVNPAQLFPTREPARVQYWIRCRRRLPPTPSLHAAALAYLSDNWLTYAGAARRLTMKDENESLYVASLNHSMWFHAPARADEWLMVDCEGIDAGGGRAFTNARAYTRDGRLVLSLAQECLLVNRADAPADGAGNGVKSGLRGTRP